MIKPSSIVNWRASVNDRMSMEIQTAVANASAAMISCTHPVVIATARIKHQSTGTEILLTANHAKAHDTDMPTSSSVATEPFDCMRSVSVKPCVCDCQIDITYAEPIVKILTNATVLIRVGDSTWAYIFFGGLSFTPWLQNPKDKCLAHRVYNA